ncbi:MAG: helix-turn-helix transcriptional regulator [Rhodospirillaceae bacterium]|nr:helix-turn-helix transcriptional regulator [Rhodospirillaceae bacterium]
MAAEVLGARWTFLILRELLSGSARYSDIKRGVPRISPTLLSKRLKELEAAGILTARRGGPGGNAEYRLTASGEELRPIVMQLGAWGQRWIDSSLSLKNLDPSLLMWDMRRNINVASLPHAPCIIQFEYPELKNGRHWWLVADDRNVDLCSIDPGHEVDLFVTGSLRSMTAVWMGAATIKAEVEAGRIMLDGDRALAGAIHKWLGLSPFAKDIPNRRVNRA